MTLHFYWTYLETQKGPNYWYEWSFFVWCLLRQRNGGWNSGQKRATIVTDAFNFFHLIELLCLAKDHWWGFSTGKLGLVSFWISFKQFYCKVVDIDIVNQNKTDQARVSFDKLQGKPVIVSVNITIKN